MTNSWINWEMTWRALRTRGIPLNVSSTMWRAVHNLLPTKDKMDKISNIQGAERGKCRLCPQITDNIFHSLTQCQNSGPAADFLLKIVQFLHQPACMYDLLYLQCDTKNVLYLPIVWLTSTDLHLIWRNKSGGGITPKKLLAELLVRNKVLYNSKYSWEHDRIQVALSAVADQGVG